MVDQDDAEYTFTHGSIDRIEVENFKSYRGLQSIGPFKAFTAVIGPNGSGKSNLMDAISFVLGVRTTQLRGNLKELLYVNSLGTTEADCPRRGHVRLVFRTAGKDGQAGEEVAFTRAIQPVGSESDKYQSVYKVADKTSSWEGYSAALGSHGILVKVRNFLVFQGDIEAIASRTPKELTALFEQISGSEALKADYERLELEHAQAEKDSQLLADKKKHLTMEKRQKKEQKEEAEKHLAMLEDLRGQKAHHLLWQLYHLDRDLRSARQDKRNLEQHLQKLAADNMGVDKQVEEAKKAAAGHAKEKMLLEKKMKKLVTDKDKKSPSLIKVKEEMTRVNKRLKAAEKDVGEVRAAVDEQQKKVKKLEKELKLVNADQAKLAAAGAAHYAEHDGEGGSNLRSADVQEEYARLKADAGTKTARVERDRAMLQQEQETDAQELARLRGCATQLTARAEHLRGQVGEAATRRTALEANLAAARQELEEKIKRRDKLDGDRRTVSNLYEVLTRDIAKIEEELASVKQHRRESDRDRKLTENIAALKRLFPGVHGRFPDLGKAHQRRHHLALAVAMGRDIDTVVVEDQATVVGCIAHLKEQRLPPITFLALTTVREKPKHINERLRHLGGTAKLAVDLIQFDAAFEGAFIFALSNTLICDTAAEARVLAFGTDGERHKVVSVDGTSITQGGLMTGGGVGSLGDRAARFDDKAVGEAKAKRLDLQAQLQALPAARQLQEEEQQLRADLVALTGRIRYIEADLKTLQEKAAKLAGEATNAEGAAQRETPQMDRLEAAVAARTTEIEVLTQRANGIVDRVFAAFSAAQGLTSIREFEERHEQFEASSREERLKLAKKEARVKEQIAYEKARNLPANVTKLEADMGKDKARLQVLQASVEEEQAGVDADDAKMADLVKQVADVRAQVEARDAGLKELRKVAAQATGEGMRVRGKVAAAAVAEELVAGRVKELLDVATVEQAVLPRKAGAAADMMDVDGEEDGGGAGPSAGGDGASGSGTALAASATAAAATLGSLDFSSLKPKQLIVKDKEAVQADMRDKMEELQTKLDHSAPNLKAMEQFEAVKQREAVQEAKLVEARAASKALTDQFLEVHTQRVERFQKAFDHIAKEIETIYKQLTSSAQHVLGGQAYLSLENKDEPFAGGIKYNAMPPTKRFRDMEQLSGGEKTMAGIALMFAIHSYRPSPFFVLDEVDAALDNTNVARVAHYIRNKTREGSDKSFQSIVISLKDNFYEKADALVGVARDLDHGCSTTFSFDLDSFEPPAQADP